MRQIHNELKIYDLGQLGNKAESRKVFVFLRIGETNWPMNGENVALVIALSVFVVFNSYGVLIMYIQLTNKW